MIYLRIDYVPSCLRYRQQRTAPHPTRISVASGSVGGLDERGLEKLVDKPFREASTPSKRRTYASAQGRYLEFCKVTARIPVPVNEHSLYVYVAWLHGQGLAPQTIKSYLSAVRYLQIACNLGDPNIATMPRLEYVLKGVKVERARQLPGRNAHAYRSPRPFS